MIDLRREKKRHIHAPDVARLTVLLALCLFSLLFAYFQTNKLSYRNSSAIFAKITARNAGSTSTIVEVMLDDNVSNTTKYAASKDYSWVGKRWVPPPGVPYLSPKDILLLFQAENTIWWGDSTGRQDYQTMYHMLNADDIHNIHGLELDLDRNKGNFGNQSGIITFHCPNRVPRDLFFADLGQVMGTNCSNSSSSIGKFDLAERGGDGVPPCFKNILSQVRNKTSLLQREYSVMILSVGIWEVVAPHHCITANTSETPYYFLEELLNALQLISGPSLYIIWKTQGPSERETNDKGKQSLKLIETAQNWFSTHSPSHMGLSDFGSEMNNGNRIFGQDRMIGDSSEHFGVEARTLSIQMASHLVYRKNEKESAVIIGS